MPCIIAIASNGQAFKQNSLIPQINDGMNPAQGIRVAEHRRNRLLLPGVS
jgi:hypothetical protein